MRHKDRKLRQKLIAAATLLLPLNIALVVGAIWACVHDVCVGLAFVIFSIVILGLSAAYFFPILLDLKLPCKTVQTRVVKKWRREISSETGIVHHYYFIKVDAFERKLEVDRHQYFSLDEGDMVRLEYHPHSKVVEEVTAIKG